MPSPFPTKNQLRSQKRAQAEADYDIAYAEQQAEEKRKSALSMWERIEEYTHDTSINDLRDILHRLANGERE